MLGMIYLEKEKKNHKTIFILSDGRGQTLSSKGPQNRINPIIFNFLSKDKYITVVSQIFNSSKIIIGWYRTEKNKNIHVHKKRRKISLSRIRALKLAYLKVKQMFPCKKKLKIKGKIFCAKIWEKSKIQMFYFGIFTDIGDLQYGQLPNTVSKVVRLSGKDFSHS